MHRSTSSWTLTRLSSHFLVTLMILLIFCFSRLLTLDWISKSWKAKLKSILIINIERDNFEWKKEEVCLCGLAIDNWMSDWWIDSIRVERFSRVLLLGIIPREQRVNKSILIDSLEKKIPKQNKHLRINKPFRQEKHVKNDQIKTKKQNLVPRFNYLHIHNRT